MPQDSATLALQIQTLTTSVEELTRQNQEMRLQLQHKENRSPTRTGTNPDNDGDSRRRDDHRRPNTSDEANLDLFREMRREMVKGSPSPFGWDGQKNRLTLHHESPRVPYAPKVSSPTT